MLPISVDIDTGKNWALEASRPGYVDYHQSITFDDGQAERALRRLARPTARRHERSCLLRAAPGPAARAGPGAHGRRRRRLRAAPTARRPRPS